MSFAGNYLLKQNFNSIISESPANDIGIIVVIPCYNEPDVLTILNSLKNCNSPKCSVEVIIVVNSSEISSNKAIEQNKKTLQDINEWKLINQTYKFKIYGIVKENISKKLAGAGYARKIGMDEAANRFNIINNTNGIIVSLDADCICEKNYFTEIEKLYIENPNANACTIYYEHPLDGNEFMPEVYDAIAQYELYLRYYNRALRTIGFPYAYQTIGSCFSVKANIYCKQGGMNKKNAGEDFYFLQKIIPLGNFHEINTTRVIPSPRPSSRVPFGTGPVINKLINGEIKNVMTYSLQAFYDLKNLFENIDKLFRIEKDKLVEFSSSLPQILSEYCKEIDFTNIVEDANNNSGSLINFRKRFYNHFNAFRVLKFLNFSHTDYYKQKPVCSVAVELLEKLNYTDIPEDIRELLLVFRKIDRIEIF